MLLEKFLVLADSTFDKFENAGRYGNTLDGYGNLREALIGFGRFCYQTLSLVAVYCSGIAIMITALCLILNARNRIKLGEAKENVVKVMIVSMLIFSVSGIIRLVQTLAITGV